MKQLIIAFTLLFIISVSSANASAVGLEYYGVEVTINPDLSVTNMVVLDFDGPVSHLEYNLDFTVENLKYEADFDFADCQAINSNAGSTISCDFIGMTDEKNKVTLTFDTRNVIRKVDDNYRFTVNYGIDLPITSSFVLIRLPEESTLAGEQNESFVPSTGSPLTDGKRIMVFWEDEALTSGQNLQFSVLFKRPAFSSEFFAYLLYGTVIIAAIAIAAVVFYVKRIRGESVAAVKSILSGEEKRIIDILSGSGGKAPQKVIVRETDFSKAKVSRIVKALKERGVVDTEAISGRENRVILRLGQEMR